MGVVHGHYKKGEQNMTRYYKDFYGCTASLTTYSDGMVRLIIHTGRGSKVLDKEYTSFKGAKIAMGRTSDGWHEIRR